MEPAVSERADVGGILKYFCKICLIAKTAFFRHVQNGKVCAGQQLFCFLNAHLFHIITKSLPNLFFKQLTEIGAIHKDVFCNRIQREFFGIMLIYIIQSASHGRG